MIPNDMQQNSNVEKPKRWPYLWLTIGTLLLAFSNGSFTIPLATWLAPVFLLRFCRTQKPVRGLALVFLAHIVAYAIAWSTMMPTSGVLELLIYTSFFSYEGLAMSRDLASIGDADKSTNPWDGRQPRAANFVELLRSRFPQFEVKNLSPILDDVRLIKSPAEQDLIRRATVISGQAMMECMRSMKPGLFEYEIAALAKFVFLRNGAQGDAYHAIAASGPNMIHPHYNANFRRMEDGDLFILDYAPDYRYYMSDLTRTWPVNGKFNDWQRELYGFYVKCYQAILKAIRPHERASVILKEAVAEMKEALAETEFSKDIYEKAAKSFIGRFTRASSYAGSRLGHWVGLSTHDVGRDSGPLRPGMVFTIEPALRVPEENIYIRCEDLIIIHQDRAEIVSDFLPLEIDDVEKLMKEEGLLQRYSRIK